jgi:short-subunit dehydrogenase
MVDARRYGPWALIAGGSEGMAVHFAHSLAAAGINVVLVARKPEPLEALAREVREAYPVQVRTLSLDLTAPDMLERIRAVTDDVEVGLLIYNAGDAGGVKPFLEHTLDTAMKAIQLNVLGTTKLAHHFGSKMAARGRGGIMLLGSMAGNAGTPRLATYCGAKAYEQLFAEALWGELKPLGVDVLIQVLGATDTPARTRAGTQDIEGFPVQTAEEVARQALDELADGGPVIMPPPLKDMFYQLSGMPRRQAAEMMRDTVSAKAGD